MKGKSTFTKAEAIALEILLQQHAKAPAHKQSALREQMQLLGLHSGNFAKGKCFTVTDFRRCATVIPNPAPLPKPSPAVSISAILEEYFDEHAGGGSLSELTIDYRSDLLLQLGRIGFSGFATLARLRADRSLIPDVQGLYLVLHLQPQQAADIAFVEDYLKLQEEYRAKWVDFAKILYIGRSTKSCSSDSLRSHLQSAILGSKLYLGDARGRYLQALRKPEDLLICWKEVPACNPQVEQRQLLKDFVNFYGKVPFAQRASAI